MPVVLGPRLRGDDDIVVGSFISFRVRHSLPIVLNRQIGSNRSSTINGSASTAVRFNSIDMLGLGAAASDPT